MIGFFPTPYPDELLYSVCARYGKRANYPNKQRAIKELFGRKGLSAVVDFPNRLEKLLNALPSNNFTADEIISKNTLFPFYEPFLNSEKVEQIRGEMRFSEDNHIRMRVAVNIPQVKFPEYLRFCPLCVEDDRTTYGETFWHRVHQLAGVLVCRRHNCFLQNSVVRWDRESAAVFYCAEESLNMQPPRFLCNENSEHQLFVYLAKNAEWLLDQESLCLDEGALRERYYNLLLERGFAYYNGKIRSNKLFGAFNEHYGPQTLEKLGCTIRSARKGWLANFTNKQRANIINHPLRHLLVMNFLNLTAKDYFTAFVEYEPFGKGNYPCLNRAANHYGQLLIPHCRVFDNQSKNKKTAKRPLGVFSCSCGFTYQRIGPDKSMEDRSRYDLVREYGKVWEDKLEQLWSDVSISVGEIARRLQVTNMLVVRHAIRLDLPMNKPNTRTAEGYSRYRNPNKSFSQMKKQYRQDWKKVIKENSDLTRKELSGKESFLYMWLKKNDYEWIENHLPKVKKVSREEDYFDWQKIDNDISSDVEQICQDILASTNPLIRVCVTEIIRRNGNKCWIEKRNKKLLKTAEIINRYSESFESFMLRKIKFATARYIAEKKIPSRMTFLALTGLRNRASENSPAIQEAITKALNKIKSYGE